MPSNGALVACQSGFEDLLAEEVRGLGLTAGESGPGWVLASGPVDRLRESAFAHAFIEEPAAVAGEKVNELAQGIMEIFSAGIRGERLEEPWPCLFGSAHEITGLGRRVASVEAAFMELLRRKLGRIARLASQERPRLGPSKGLFVWFTDFGRVQVSRTAHFCGQRRMADDDAAPSRSYLKVEESYALLGSEPGPGQTVCDLGAAPGGWSYSAAKRGASVVAVDNGPLKGGALGNPLITHRTDDAFGFRATRESRYDWLFCDMLDDPHHILQSIVHPWLSGGWCRNYVINIKFGRVVPVAFLGEMRSPDSPFVKYSSFYRISHLYHDREEFTVVGRVAE